MASTDTERNLKLNNLITQKTWTLTERQLCDLECLLNGAFAPLTGFLEQQDYEAVCDTMRLSDGTLWPIPITLDVPAAFAKTLAPGEKMLLINTENTPLATLTVHNRWLADKQYEALSVFGTTDLLHPGVHVLFNETHDWYIGGPIQALAGIHHYDFVQYRHSPAELKQLFSVLGWSKIIAFQTRNPIHRAHYELTLRGAKAVDAHLLLHPVVGLSKPGDVHPNTRIKCYEKVLDHYPKNTALLSLLPLAMRMAGPREAIWHAIIRKNYGVTHFIVGRDHAGPGLNSQGNPFYPPYAAQEQVIAHAADIGIEIVAFPAIVYVQNKARFLTIEEIDPEDAIDDLSGTELRHRLEHHLDIPDWYSFPDVLDVLKQAYPAKTEQGYTVFFTGLSGAGKSTLAKALMAKLLESQSRKVTLLDGDIIRRHLSPDLGFSKADRDINIQRLSFIASEITKHKGIAICAAIAPYSLGRAAFRRMIAAQGGFIEVYVATSLTVCKQRDIKGLYQKAELGLITGFTGVNDPYEVPNHPDLIIDTAVTSIPEALSQIVSTIETLGYKTL